MFTLILCWSDTVDMIYQDLNNVSNLAIRNSLLINPNKSQVILFSRIEIDVSSFQILLNNTALDWADEVINVGLYMDKGLTFDSHVKDPFIY